MSPRVTFALHDNVLEHPPFLATFNAVMSEIKKPDSKY